MHQNWQGIYSGNIIVTAYFHSYSLITGLIQDPPRFPEALINVNIKGLLNQICEPSPRPGTIRTCAFMLFFAKGGR